jgi:predicted RNA-binding Zn ribbon-like protein
MTARWLALELAATIRHDGSGGIADDLADQSSFAWWLERNADLLADCGPALYEVGTDDRLRQRVIELRRAVRSLFGHAIAPAEPSRAEAGALLPLPEALELVNGAAVAAPYAPQLVWEPGGPPQVVHRQPATDAGTALLAALAHAVIDFLASEDRARLHACPAPRCVRYFLRERPQQAWCKPSCGNRARVARHYQRHASTDPHPARGA